MHIEPGVVDATKLALSYATGVASLGLVGKMAADAVRTNGGLAALIARSVATASLALAFFEVLPHAPVGPSEVHLILGTTLFLVFGAGAASIGLVAGLLMQGLFLAPYDLPQLGMNVTTLVVPLYLMSLLAARIIPEKTAYTDLSYRQTLALSAAFQAGIVGWVAFWVVYGQGFGAETLTSLAAFGGAYMSVILLEPLVDLTVLAGAKALGGARGDLLLQNRLYQPAV